MMVVHNGMKTATGSNRKAAQLQDQDGSRPVEQCVHRTADLIAAIADSGQGERHKSAQTARPPTRATAAIPTHTGPPRAPPTRYYDSLGGRA